MIIGGAESEMKNYEKVVWRARDIGLGLGLWRGKNQAKDARYWGKKR